MKQKLKQFTEKYERYLLPSFLLGGVAVDFLTFKTISLQSAFVLLGVHIILAGSMIAFINYYDEDHIAYPKKPLRILRNIAPLILQLSFGALLSASLIFYWFSGTISISWPFILVIALLMVSNDVFREYYQRPAVQISVYFFALFSVFSLTLPFLFKSLESSYFLLAGATSLVVIYLYVTLLSKRLFELKRQRSHIAITVVVIAGLMNAMYFLNVIPPIPLSLREAGIYHDVIRAGGVYTLKAEDENFLQKLLPGRPIHINPSNRVYAFTSIFAPDNLNTNIVHHWQYFDPVRREWITRSKPTYGISGGRVDGYRGFSFNSNMTEGSWRVSVETPRGQVLGRIRFKVIHVDNLPNFKLIDR